MHRFRPLLATILLAASLAQAQQDVRAFPPDARKGRLSHWQGMEVLLDGKPVLLAAGAQIRSASNLIIVPTAVPPNSTVRYQLDAEGAIRRAWVLTSAESAAR